MYTEDEARKKWCPEARVVTASKIKDSVRLDGGTMAYNRVCVPDDFEIYARGATCSGSECMEWRWSGHTMLRILDSIPYNDSEVEQFMKMRKRLKDSIKDGSVSDPERGYCGLGGAPRG